MWTDKNLNYLSIFLGGTNLVLLLLHFYVL